MYRKWIEMEKSKNAPHREQLHFQIKHPFFWKGIREKNLITLMYHYIKIALFY